ncbi:sodium channel protein Nach [Atheta coriaria]|uniref:sodium channel protein Nach n=1 Tax=Dalotia coriaria TaxID=877792 RepID=UPI0031F361BB
MLSWLGTSMLIRANWDDYQNNAIQFVAETSYLDWDTQFPSVTVCEVDNQDRIADVTDEIYGDPHDYNLDEVVKELVYYKGLNFYTLQICGDPETRNAACSLSNFTVFSDMVRSNCEQIFAKCMWNNKPFDCCKYFHPMNTELGVCFSINSRQTTAKKPEFFDMISNRKVGVGTFYLEIKVFSNIYVLGEQEVPSLTTLQTEILQISPQIRYHRYFALTEIENQAEVRDVSIVQRNCRFMDESYLNVYKYYSYSACSVQCRRDAQLARCNCSHHLIPNTKPEQQCTITGLECLNKNYDDLAVLKAPWAKRKGIVCFCVPSCTEIELSIVKDDKSGIDDNYAIVELSLDRLPSERFKRSVVKGRLDLVVSMGGTTALFIGASLLSFVEIFYYLLLRPLSNYILRRKPTKPNQKQQNHKYVTISYTLYVDLVFYRF